MNILIKIKSNGKFIEKINKKGQLILDDGSILNRKSCNCIEIICDFCEGIILWKSVPSKEYLLKKEFLCRSCRQLGDRNSQFGKKWTENRKLLKSEKMIGEKNYMYKKSFYDIWLEKYGKEEADKLLEEHKNKSKKIGLENGMYGKKFYDVWLERYGKEEADKRLSEFKINKSKWLIENPEHHNKMIINSHIRKYKKTSIEKIVEKSLQESGINIKYNFILDNKFQFDFFLKEKNLIIETHGDYWHANPLYYSDEDNNKKKLNENQKYKIDLDKIKFDYLSKRGYNIIYLWETDIKNGNFKKILKEYGVY